ncbi:XRE family transcriptional regulator [Burkholderia sp. Ac-20349]|uniref:helix-turn-helix domain-containing protein n=1 Tax=Burkholderia sp. Ac-20349 TaxID=2703893 RepID=UPI00197B4EB9|nr:XRE family transcriptional regulator [Burkholderia sp. Ac-20349]MBN3838766.1 helix-turn-helix domain-containing protein [Burkholderia sp. Ac-20349]
MKNVSTKTVAKATKKKVEPELQSNSKSSSINRTEVGARLRTRRKALGLTLKDLARDSGVTLSTISKAELGEIGLTYDKFGALAKALKLDFSDLFGHPDDDIALEAVHTTSGNEVFYDTDCYRYGLIAADRPNKRMTPVRAIIKARKTTDFSEYIRHEGEEYVYVLRGSVRLLFETGASYDLALGDSLYFNSAIGHIYLSTGKGHAELLGVCLGSSPPEGGVI